MIPRIIHYCWFGGNSLPKSAKKCIASWRKFLPDYEIKEWNESNYDVHKIPYIHEAYEAKKYAFVSDYARFDILYHFGGIYFDTDVQVIKPMDDIIAKGPFMGREAGAYLRNICEAFVGNVLAVAPGLGLGVNPGLGLGVNPGLGLYKELLDAYNDFNFLNVDGTLNTKTIVSYTSEILVKHGLNSDNENPQFVAGVWIYPADVFCPMDHTRGNIVTITERTRSIHRYDASWSDHHTFRYKLHLLKNWMMQRLGVERVQKLVKIIKPYLK